MVSSPGLVIYAELLLLVQYVYGLQLTDDELPLQDPTGTFDYSELGLKKWQFPCLHLGAQVRNAISRMHSLILALTFSLALHDLQ